MRIFLSAGEPSGDMHGANLVASLRREAPHIECAGFGGPRMQEAGCRLNYPLCQLALMGFANILPHAPVFLSLISKTDRYFRHQRPDAVVLIDYPGFNWWVARRAHFHGIPVFYFIPPQLWGWGGWRVRKMQRWVVHVLCTLPFEESWYHERGVPARYLGHPYFDELPRQRLDGDFLAAQRNRPGPIIALLPGSRNQEVSRNFGSMVRAAAKIHAARPDSRFLVACFSAAHRANAEDYLRRQPDLPIEVCSGRTPEIIESAHACLAVSGSVSLELLYRGKPSLIVYRINRVEEKLTKLFKTSPYITLVNLLAGRELFREFLTRECPAAALAEQILSWLNDASAYAAIRAELAELRARVAVPGACARAAQYILQTLAGRAAA